MNIAERIAQTAYGKSAAPDAAENQGDDWRQGYAAGVVLDLDADRLEVMSWEFDGRGRPNVAGSERDAWNEWKRGFWSGVWTKADQAIDRITIDFNEYET